MTISSSRSNLLEVALGMRMPLEFADGYKFGVHDGEFNVHYE